MARIRTIKPDFWTDEKLTERKKARISGAIRRNLAHKHGCKPGDSIIAKCANCFAPGRIEWRIGVTGRGNGQVIFSHEIDHITPEALGGETLIENLQLLCRACNRSKGSKPAGVNHG